MPLQTTPRALVERDGMKDLAAFLEAGPATGARFQASGLGAVAAEILQGRRVMGIGAVLEYVSAGLPGEVLAECLGTCTDRAEAAALLMGPSGPGGVSLEEVRDVTAEGVLALAARMTQVERAWFFRLISGRRRGVEAATTGGPGESLAVLTGIEGALGQFALRRGNGFVPLVKLSLGPYAPEVLAWAKGAQLEKFGPLRLVRAEQVFRIAWEGQLANGRRKLGHDLVGARILAWERGTTVDRVPEA